ncbi:hypothetical protein AOLI_G00194480 [Acnodon oligacanthus]
MTSDVEQECHDYDYTTGQSDSETEEPLGKRKKKQRFFVDFVQERTLDPCVKDYLHRDQGVPAHLNSEKATSVHNQEDSEQVCSAVPKHVCASSQSSVYGSVSHEASESPQPGPFPMSTARFQKCVLGKLVEIIEEVRRVGRRFEPEDSDFHIQRMDTEEEFDVLETELKTPESRQFMIAQLSKVGGKNTKDCTNQILDRLFTNGLMMKLI